MGIQYSGSIYSSTFTTTTGTRREIVDNMAAKLVAAGWSYQSGSGTGDVKMLTATVPTSNNKTVVRISDPGSGNCAKFQLYHSAGTVNQAGGCFLLPAANKVFQVIANPYQFCVFVKNSLDTREFIMGGAPYIPSWNSGITEAGWIQGNAVTDTDAGTGTRASFRQQPFVYNTTNNPGNQCAYINTTLMEGNNSNFGVAAAPGVIQLAGHIPYTHNWNTGTPGGVRWIDGSGVVSEPIIGWCNSTTPGTTDAIAVGSLWDAFLLSQAFPGDATMTMDSHSWHNIMVNCVGINSYNSTVSLWLATS